MGLLPEAVAGGSLGHLTHTAQVHTKVNRVVDVKADFAAVGNGVTDDTTAIQNAITAAGVGGRVYFPPGTYMLSASLQGEDSLQLVGADKKVSILKVAAGHTGTHILNLQGDTDCLIENLGFDGSSSTTTITGIRTNTASTVKNLTVRRCYFVNILPNTVTSYGTTAGALWLWTADSVDIYENEILDCGRGIIIDEPTSGRAVVRNNRITNTATNISSSGILIKKGTTFSTDTRVIIADNYIAGCQRDPTDVDPYTGNGQEGHGIAVSRARGIRIINNTCVNNGRGILCSNESMDTQVIGNQCYQNTDSGIRVEPESSTQDVTIGTAGDQRGLIIANNVCRDNGSGFQHLGYYGKGIEISYAAGCVVMGNICYGNMHAGIHCDSVGVAIIANQCYNNWKGTYVPPGSAKGGIRIAGGSLVVNDIIIGNHCYDNQTTKTQEYGLTLNGSGTGHLVQGNNFANNSLGEVDDTTKIKHAFFGTPPVTKPTVTGAKGGNAALGSLLSALSTLGLITDTTTA